MSLNEHDIRRILDAYLEGRATPEEEDLLTAFFDDHKNEALRENLREAEYALIEERIRSGIKRRISFSKKRSPVFQWAVAASVTAVLAVSFVYYVLYRNQPDEVPTQTIAFLTRTAEKGQKLTVRLPDGSVVKLNSGSAMSFPEKFTGNQRHVTLEGEAYFDVVHNPSAPFVVQSALGKTTVLGTSFNVKDRGGISEITLVSGKVEVTRAGHDAVTLNPNEQAWLAEGSSEIHLRAVDVSPYVEWKDNVISFDRTPLREAAQRLEDWYGVEITIANAAMEGCRITGRYHNESLENVLESFRFMLKGSYTIADKKITISGKGCK